MWFIHEKNRKKINLTNISKERKMINFRLVSLSNRILIMSKIPTLPFQLLTLSEDFKISSVPYSGWPPPITIPSVHNLNQVDPEDFTATPFVADQIYLSTGVNRKSYFEKLRYSVQRPRTSNMKSHLTTTNVSSLSENLLENMFENLIRSKQSCGTWNLDDIKTIKSPADRLLSQLELLKHIYIDNEMIKSVPNKASKFTSSIMTPDGNILFDFSKQSINHKIHMELMQLVRLSNLDKFIEKVFHKSGYLT
jgi:hypothetical protein